MRTNISKIEKLGVENYVITLRHEGYSFREIAEKVNEIIPDANLSTDNVAKFIKSHPHLNKMSSGEVVTYKVLNNMRQILDKIWQLEAEAEQFLKKAKETEDRRSMVSAIRACNEVLRTCLAVARELKAPSETLKVDVRHQTINYMINIINQLPKDSQMILRKQIEEIYERELSQSKEDIEDGEKENN